MPTFNSLTSRTDAAALIPEEVASEIIKSLPTKSAALASFRHVTMGRAQQRMPVLSALPVAYWVDGSSDTSLKQTSELLWGNKYLDARELAVIIPVPEAVVDDADYDIWGEAKPLIVESIGSLIDAATIFNTNNPWPQAATYQGGIAVQAVAAGNSVLEGTGVDFAEDVSNTFGKVEQDGYDVNIVFARKKVKARLRNLRSTTREPIFQDIANGQPATLYGEQLTYVSNQPWVNNYEIVAGDRNMAILGIRQDITYKIFTEGVISDDSGNVILNLMQQDAVAMRVVMRVGFATAAPINLDNTVDATRYPFAVLINAGS